MKYYRMDSQRFEGNKLVNGFYIYQQDEKSYNWKLFKSFDSLQEMYEFGKLLKSEGNVVYKENGYGL